MRYNQKLATICDYLQAIDKNGFYHELLDEYSNGEISLTDALEECKQSLESLKHETDVTDARTIQSFINYINY
ncbi:hypothetical protein JOC34_000474 [Virgibacillus halotolerans]|uniref:hypothetical protein n=1 Tax=Virgibacillus halotolerans TaxID=1071053 RepID=UPI00195F4415|nr:hypothetical protein [Virgibacillus halotolerans]MBM7598117.1 hypothetical protein [Virgibacillus halotolerans]